jgi:hypothetical protein
MLAEFEVTADQLDAEVEDLLRVLSEEQLIDLGPERSG